MFTMAGDVDATIAEFMATQHGVAHRRDVRRLGASARVEANRVATGRWREPQPHVFAINGSPATDRQQLLAAVLAAPIGTVASHRSAARLYGIPGFERAAPEILVPRPRRKVGQIVQAIVHHTTQLPPWQHWSRDAIPVTTVARTLFDLGAVVHPGARPGPSTTASPANG